MFYKTTSFKTLFFLLLRSFTVKSVFSQMGGGGGGVFSHSTIYILISQNYSDVHISWKIIHFESTFYFFKMIFFHGKQRSHVSRGMDHIQVTELKVFCAPVSYLLGCSSPDSESNHYTGKGSLQEQTIWNRRVWRLVNENIEQKYKKAHLFYTIVFTRGAYFYFKLSNNKKEKLILKRNMYSLGLQWL